MTGKLQKGMYDWIAEAGQEQIKDAARFLFVMLRRIIFFPLFLVGAISWIIDAKRRGKSWLWNFKA